MERESPLDYLARLIREVEHEREVFEKAVERTPGWRFRRRTRLQRRVDRRLREEKQLTGLAQVVSKKIDRRH